MRRANSPFRLLNQLGIDPFQERFPWFGGDLQTLRDTFVKDKLPNQISEQIKISVPDMPGFSETSGSLIAFLDLPTNAQKPKALVIMLHGLGGSSRRIGLRRMSATLSSNGFAVLRLNLRGADPCRNLIAGTYAAQCNSDLFPVISKAREIADSLSEKFKITNRKLPVYGVGISLGGTILLNACLTSSSLIDGLVCISSPLDLLKCSVSIERGRNSFYQSWILNRLIKQTVSDPFGIREKEKRFFKNDKRKVERLIKTIRQFDIVITAPRWGFKDVDDYYFSASPLNKIIENQNILPPTLFIQSKDDPWVTSEPFLYLEEEMSKINCSQKLHFVLSNKGGHNGFHGTNGCWGDYLVSRWLLKISN